MAYLRYVALCGILLFGVPKAPAQDSYDVGADSNYDYSPNYDYSDDYRYSNVGPEPVCPYGYYEYYPYACAPYGYYGPTYFIDGVFIGVGPWYQSYDGGGYYGGGYYGGYGGND